MIKQRLILTTYLSHLRPVMWSLQVHCPLALLHSGEVDPPGSQSQATQPDNKHKRISDQIFNMITLQNYYHRMHEAMWSYNIPRFKVEKGFEIIQTYHQLRSHWCRRSCPDTAHTADLWHTFYRDIDLCRWGGRHYFPAPCRGGHIHTL